MRKVNKAFTLIELLAVIVILAIISLIATPIILGVVEGAKKDSFQRSVELIVSTTSVDIVGKNYDEEYTYTIEDGTVSNLEVGIKNTQGLNGSIIYDKAGNEAYAIHNENYCVIKNEQMEQAEIVDYIEGECNPTSVYENGQIVYFDVVKGTGCTMEEYAASYNEDVADFLNSKNDYNGLNGSNGQNSCLMFYAFNDDGGNNINLILDHNTTAVSFWTEEDSDDTKNGPITVLSELRRATDFWNGTIVPENYTVYQEGIEDDENIIYADYTIAYKTEEYKARLLTADEVAQITGADVKEKLMFDESTCDDSYYFFFKTLTYDSSGICTENCKYNWLYDRTYSACESYGCANNAFGEQNLLGYWTATSQFGYFGYAWIVDGSGSLVDAYVAYDDKYIPGTVNGVRPVITVSKMKITPGVPPEIPIP